MFKVDLKKKILDANEQCAFENTKLLAEKKVLCLNMISSPGSGKTTILAKTITDLKDRLKIAVIEGDVKTDIDTQKIKTTGAPAVQINTHGACHLTAEQITAGLHNLPLDKLDTVFIENVGNLVCPTDFELGENAKLAVLSVTEGDDKPAKYPAIFSKAKALLINKMDLLKVVEFDLERVKADARKLNPSLEVFPISAKTGEGMQDWYDWLMKQPGQKPH